MAACLRSLRLGVPPLLPGGVAGGGIPLGRSTRPTHRPAQGISSLHVTSSCHKAVPAPQHQQRQHQQRQHQQRQQQGKVEWRASEGTHHSTPIPFHSFHSLDFPPCPSAHTLDDIEVQCRTAEKNQQINNESHQARTKQTANEAENNTKSSIRTFCLPPNALWYPREATHLKNGSVLCSVSYSELETQVMDCVAERPYFGLASPQTTPLEDTENREHARENGLSRGVDSGSSSVGNKDGRGTRENGLNWHLESGITGGAKENQDSGGLARQDFDGEYDNSVVGNGGFEGYRANGNGCYATGDEVNGHRRRWVEGEGYSREGSERNRVESHWVQPGRGQGVCDMAVFIKEMGLRETEVQLCSMSSPLASSASLSCSSLSSSSASPSSSASGNVDPRGKPSPEQLSFVFNKLADTLPRLFTHPLDYTIYSQNIVFENRIRGVRTEGLFSYVRQVSLLRTIGHLKFAYVKFEILKITKHPEEGTVKVRWRIMGLSGLKAFLQFWKIKFWNWSSVERQMVSWYDGFSTFHIGSDGLVHLHVADSMMPDEEAQVVNKGPLAVKMAALLGLVPKPSTGSLNTSPDTPAAPPTAAVKTVEGTDMGSVTCGRTGDTVPAAVASTAATTTVPGDVGAVSPPPTATPAASATTVTAFGFLDLFDEERDSCAGLMLPLEKIF